MNRRYTRRGWSRGHLLNLALGQGELLATPIQLAVYINKIATKGNTFIPHFLLSKVPESTNSINLNEQTWVNIENYLFNAVNHKYATGLTANPKINGIKVYGKTGTAQNPHGENHSIFIAFAPKENPKIAIAVYVENGGWGSTWAAPIASLMIEKYLKNEITNKKQEAFILNGDLIKKE